VSIKRVIIPVILALGVAGSILAGSAAPAVSAQGHAVHAVASSAVPKMHYYG
jgi:hypothetical protein